MLYRLHLLPVAYSLNTSTARYSVRWSWSVLVGFMSRFGRIIIFIFIQRKVVIMVTHIVRRKAPLLAGVPRCLWSRRPLLNSRRSEAIVEQPPLRKSSIFCFRSSANTSRWLCQEHKPPSALPCRLVLQVFATSSGQELHRQADFYRCKRTNRAFPLPRRENTHPDAGSLCTTLSTITVCSAPQTT